MNLLPQKEAVMTDLQPFKQEREPLVKIWSVSMEGYTHQPDELNSHLKVMKIYLKARCRLSDLISAQRNDRMTSNLKRWIENGHQTKDIWKMIVTRDSLAATLSDRNFIQIA